jgi:aspartokinase-like uncharacterized kinase
MPTELQYDTAIIRLECHPRILARRLFHGPADRIRLMEVSCVIKVGGSLLDLPDLPARLGNFLGDFSRPRPVLLCGGGPTVELVRTWDQLYDLGEEPSHWIALQALALNALLLERILPSLQRVESPKAFPGVWKGRKVPLYDAYRFIRDWDERSQDPLPRRWRVTSDSIAARMAAHFGAEEVVLLKSVTAPEGMTIVEAAQNGIVDPHFPVAVEGVPRVVVVNLREEEPRETLLTAR